MHPHVEALSVLRCPSAPLGCNAIFPRSSHLICQRPRGRCDSIIRHTQPHDFAVQRSAQFRSRLAPTFRASDRARLHRCSSRASTQFRVRGNQLVSAQEPAHSQDRPGPTMVTPILPAMAAAYQHSRHSNIRYIVRMANSRSRKRNKLERTLSSKISYNGPVFQVTTDDVARTRRSARSPRRYPP